MQATNFTPLRIAEVPRTTVTSLWVCVSWCLSASLFVRPVSISFVCVCVCVYVSSSLCACVSVPVCVCVYVSSSLCSVCVCACGVCLCTVCVCACGVCLCLCVCGVCVSLLSVSVSLSNFVSVYLCLLLLKIWHSMSISFLLTICIIFNEAFTYNVFHTAYKRVTCSSTLFALLSVKVSVCKSFCV